jgi:hypothetical protein
MRGAITPLPNTPSWRGAQLKMHTGATLPLPEIQTVFYVEYVSLFMIYLRTNFHMSSFSVSFNAIFVISLYAAVRG